MLIVKLNRNSNGLVKSKSRSLSLDVLQLFPFVPGHVFGNKRVLGLDDGEVAWLHITTSTRAKGLGLEGLNDLQSVINDFVNWQAASNHMSSSATVIDDHQGFPGNSLFSIKDSILLGDFARPVSQQWNLAPSFQTPVSSRGLHKSLVGVDRVSGHGQHSTVHLVELLHSVGEWGDALSIHEVHWVKHQADILLSLVVLEPNVPDVAIDHGMSGEVRRWPWGLEKRHV